MAERERNSRGAPRASPMAPERRQAVVREWRVGRAIVANERYSKIRAAL
jgi:hypothetical protein